MFRRLSLLISTLTGWLEEPTRQAKFISLQVDSLAKNAAIKKILETDQGNDPFFVKVISGHNCKTMRVRIQW